MKFTEFDLRPEVQKALDEMGFVDMTPIQEESIPSILEGKDIVGLAETGSGKTSACAVPLVNVTDTSLTAVQHLILVPTRELALQFVQEVDDVARYSGVVPFAVYGGFDIGIQKAKLNHGVHILVATPGRLIDLIWNTKLDLTNVRTVVLDEADEMLNMGFIDDVDFILSCLLQEHQTLLFSATMPPEISGLTEKYLTDPVRVELNKDQRAPQSLEHHFLHSGRDRLKTLTGFLEGNGVEQAIIFINTRDHGSELHRQTAAYRVVSRILARRARPGSPHVDFPPLQRAADQVHDRHRRRWSRPRFQSRQPCHQLRFPVQFRYLHPPHRPHRPHGPQGSRPDPGH